MAESRTNEDPLEEAGTCLVADSSNMVPAAAAGFGLSSTWLQPYHELFMPRDQGGATPMSIVRDSSTLIPTADPEVAL